MHTNSDRRDLSQLRHSGSTARVLNLCLVAERFGDTPEHQAAPFFLHRKLNRSLILKHALRDGDRDLFTRVPGASATKIVLPFSAQELRLGGAMIFVDQVGFERLFREALGYPNDADAKADIDVLRMLAELPSLDPFLVRERLRRQGGRLPARCYFDVSEADLARMRNFVAKEIARLVSLAFAQVTLDPEGLARRLTDKLMTDESAEALAPLRDTLRLTGEEYREGVFAWKGFLYYKWCATEMSPSFAPLLRSICGARVLKAEKTHLRDIAAVRERIVNAFEAKVAVIRKLLGAYDEAYLSLTTGKPQAFRDFLVQAPDAFLTIGEAVGVVHHIASFWRYRFPDDRPAMLDLSEALDLFGNFEASLGGATSKNLALSEW